MRTPTRFQLCAGVVTMMVSLSAQAYPGESIVLDPVTGDYTITYKSDDETATGLMTTVFVPSTKIVPTIRSSFRMEERGVISYRYMVSNGATAKQAIVGVLLEGIVNPILGEQAAPAAVPSTTITDVMAYGAANSAATPAPAGWDGDITRGMSRIDWMPKSGTLNTNGIQPGRTLTGFGFASLDLPGISTAQMDGIGGSFGYPDAGPVFDSAVLPEVERLRYNDFVVRPAAVPMVAVPTPFDAAVLLDRIQTQMHTWIGMKLLNATFSSQLDRYLTAAAETYRHNQPKAAKEDIEKVRGMLKKEHPDLGRDEEHENAKNREKNDDKKPAAIDRLAATVLDFNLAYVLKRADGEKD